MWNKVNGTYTVTHTTLNLAYSLPVQTSPWINWMKDHCSLCQAHLLYSS